MRVLAADVSAHQGQEITVSGWVHRMRNLGGVSFVMLRDRSGLVQVVYDSEPDFKRNGHFRPGYRCGKRKS